MGAWETAMQQIRELKAENERLRDVISELAGVYEAQYGAANQLLKKEIEQLREALERIVKSIEVCGDGSYFLDYVDEIARQALAASV